MPEDSQQQMSLYLRQNQLALALGRREAFMANLLPIITDSINRLHQDAEVRARTLVLAWPGPRPALAGAGLLPGLIKRAWSSAACRVGTGSLGAASCLCQLLALFLLRAS